MVCECSGNHTNIYIYMCILRIIRACIYINVCVYFIHEFWHGPMWHVRECMAPGDFFSGRAGGFTALDGGVAPGAVDGGVVTAPGEVRVGVPGVDEDDPEPCKTWISCKASASCFWRFPAEPSPSTSLGRHHQTQPKIKDNYRILQVIKYRKIW